MARLSRDEFAVALKHGRGAALMHILAHGLGDLEDIVLTACFENQAYDRQCEGHRAQWLYDMFKNAGTYSHFSDAIVAALHRDDEELDLAQVYELASLMGLGGDQAAAAALRQAVWGQAHSRDGIGGGHAIVALDGIPAIVELARRLGRIVQEFPDEYVDGLDYLTEGSLFFDEAWFELQREAHADDAIAAYVARQQADFDEARIGQNRTDEELAARSATYRDEVRRKYPLERILAAASTPSAESKYFFIQSGRYAVVEDLNCILQHLRGESDAEICIRLLWVFRTAKLPYLEPKVLDLASEKSPELRAAAIKALSSIRDPLVGELGRQRLREEAFSAGDSDVIELLTLNFKEGDDALILAALDRLTPDDDDAHALGSSVERVCSENNSPGMVKLAEWIYRTNPCTICRRSAVELLIESRGLSTITANECLYDASSEMRELVKGAMQ